MFAENNALFSIRVYSSYVMQILSFLARYVRIHLILNLYGLSHLANVPYARYVINERPLNT